MFDGLKKKIDQVKAQAPSPEVVKQSIAQGQIWKSIFRHGYPDTTRETGSWRFFPTCFSHLHPVKARYSGIKMSYTWCMGGLSFFLFLVLTVTGVLLMFYYRPTAEYAYYDIIALREHVPLGIMRELHRWGAHAMVITVWLTCSGYS